MRISNIWLMLLALFVAAVPAADDDAQGWLTAQPDYAWSFPGDHWAHAGYKTEWWYFTGHLQDENDSDRRFGYQFTFFRIGLLPRQPGFASRWSARDLIMGHASISDLASREHYFSEVLYRAIPLLGGFGVAGDTLIAWSRAPAGTDDSWTLSWNGQAFDFGMRDAAQGISFELTTRPDKPLVLQGPNGYSRKADREGAASQYYSFTRLATEGTVTAGERTSRVTGQSWMDKEFGSNQLTGDQVGWDWFSLQLDDRRELMLYLMRDHDNGIDFARGTLVEADGTVRYLSPGDWDLQVIDRWQSPRTEANYPVRWRLRLPAERLDLEIEALLLEQENVSRRSGGLYYWEGAVEIRAAAGTERGRRLGRGYVELTGYGEGSRPPI